MTSINRSTLQAARALLATLAVAAGACQTAAPRLSEQEKSLRTELAALKLTRNDRAHTRPLIDVHVHTFNARYLPLRGILQGKRDKAGVLGVLLSDRCAADLAKVIVDRTELSPFAGSPGVKPKSGRVDLAELDAPPGPLCNVFIRLINKAADEGAWDKSLSPEKRLKIVDQLAKTMSPAEQLAVRSAARMMGMDHALEEPPMPSASNDAGRLTFAQRFMRFLWTLTQNDVSQVDLYRNQHLGGDDSRRLTIVSHMMDLGPVYAQSPGQDLLRFTDQQIPRLKAQARNSNGSLLYFVAYNPYRDDAEGGQPGTALRIVQDAVLHHGARGVKVYPPSGYRAASNDIKSRPCSIISSQPGVQWDARYKRLAGDDKERSAALDAKLEALLLWCIEKDVPVFTHAGYGEFEARSGYGKHHAHPRWWAEFLAKHSRPGSPCRLRLCLGHAGGEDFWLGMGKHGDWGATVLDLCTRYPNVYCEITTEGHLTHPDFLARFVGRLASLMDQSAQAPYPFSAKLLYGTDWFLPDSAEPAMVLDAVVRAFEHPLLQRHADAYFYRNAENYLRMRGK